MYQFHLNKKQTLARLHNLRLCRIYIDDIWEHYKWVFTQQKCLYIWDDWQSFWNWQTVLTETEESKVIEFWSFLICIQNWNKQGSCYNHFNVPGVQKMLHMRLMNFTKLYFNWYMTLWKNVLRICKQERTAYTAAQSYQHTCCLPLSSRYTMLRQCHSNVDSTS